MYEENKIKRTNKKNNVIIRKFKSLLNWDE
jgi:hypothetical protein